MSRNVFFAASKKIRVGERRDVKFISITTNGLQQGKKELRELQRQTLRSVLSKGHEIVVDFEIPGVMKEKDLHFLVKHTKLLYESNLNADTPFSLNFAGLKRDSLLYETFLKKFPKFEEIIVNFLEKPIVESFPNKRKIYLTPDSDKALETLDPEAVYILGGLVDYQVKKDTTLRKAMELKVETCRLPIPEYMNRRIDSKHSFSKILSINQVFSILLKYKETGSWTLSLPVGVPKRRGFVPRLEL